ncbi:Chromosome partition protein Smc [Candidatus Entotheonellaceae bacterium PAL068K]
MTWRHISVVVAGITLWLVSLAVTPTAQPQPQAGQAHQQAKERSAVFKANPRLQEQIKLLTDELAALKQGLADVRTAMQVRQAEVAKEQEHFQQVVDRQKGNIRTLQQDVADSQSRLAEAQQIIAALNQQLQRAEAENQQWQTRHAESQQALIKLQAQFQSQAIESASGLAKLKEQYSQAVQQLEASDRQRKAFLAQIAQLEVEIQQFRTARTAQVTTLAELRQALTMAQQHTQAAQTDAAQWQEQHATATEQLSQLQSNFEQLTTQSTAARQQLDAQTTELAELRQALATAEQQIQAAQTDAAQWQEQHATATEQLSQLQTDFQQLTADVAAMRHMLEKQAARRTQQTARDQMFYERIVTVFKDAIEQQVVFVQQDVERLTIRVGAEALFRPGEVRLRTKSQKILDALAAIMRKFPDYRIQVGGHTDNVPIGGRGQARWPTNWELSVVRAAAVVQYLQDQNIAPEQLTASGYAFYRPVSPNDTPEGRAHNRRIEITVALPPIAQ